MSSTISQRPQQNRILAALPIVELARLEDVMEKVDLPLGQVLYAAGASLDYVYFPISCIASLVFSTENGSSAELAMTGNDGLVGIPRVLGGETTTHRAVVQSAGVAYRLRAEVLSWELEQGGLLLHLCLGYGQALMTQMAQSVVCNRHHTVDQQLCRWLLLLLDQLDGSDIHMTQEQIATMLGVRREAVTEAAGKLQADGLIRYRRGHITVLDRAGLEARVCECYSVVRSEYERLFRLQLATPPKNRPRPNPATLRQRAEARLAQTNEVAPPTVWDTERLLHELQVHQVELEMHNEELRHAYNEADALREKYADIYDFAPVGYFTLDAQGVIIQLNLAAAILLGIKRSHHARHRFAASVHPENLAAFDGFLKDVLNGSHKRQCEIVLAATGLRVEATVRIEAVPDEERRECRMVVIDISSEKEATRALREREGYQRALLDNFPSMVWLKDEQSRYLAVNAPFAQNYGWSSVDEQIGKSDFDITTRELAEASLAEDMKIMNSGEKICTEQRVEVHGKERWFETYKSPVIVDSQLIGTVGLTRDISQRKAMEAELRSLAATDVLTALANRPHFLSRLAESFAVLQRHTEHGAILLMLDLDHFQTVNDLLGQTAGDAMLRLFSALLRDELRKVDIAGRLGGDEFAVLMPNANLDAALIFAERLRTKVAGTAVSVDQQQVAMSVSIGIAAMTADTASVDEALACAEAALRLAKANGYSQIEVAASQANGVMQTLQV
jgi:diguanylate cyclase (GGDEF)-like protein/PAS domain S-box-containing protein